MGRNTRMHTVFSNPDMIMNEPGGGAEVGGGAMVRGGGGWDGGVEEGAAQGPPAPRRAERAEGRAGPVMLRGSAPWR